MRSLCWVSAGERRCLWRTAGGVRSWGWRCRWLTDTSLGHYELNCALNCGAISLALLVGVVCFFGVWVLLGSHVAQAGLEATMYQTLATLS